MWDTLYIPQEKHNNNNGQPLKRSVAQQIQKKINSIAKKLRENVYFQK